MARRCGGATTIARRRRSAADRRVGEKAVEVERRVERRRVRLSEPRPLVERAIPGELEVVAVGIPEVDRYVRPVIGQLAQRHAGIAAAADRVGQGPRAWRS